MSTIINSIFSAISILLPIVLFLVVIFLIKNKIKQIGNNPDLIKIMGSLAKNYSNQRSSISQTKSTSANITNTNDILNALEISNLDILLNANNLPTSIPEVNEQNFNFRKSPTVLKKRNKYLHIALNNTLEEARNIISKLPSSDRILIEIGTPLIKIYGTDAITNIKSMTAPGTYIIADNKCADLASYEVRMMSEAGANAATCLGVAPIETIDSFIEECGKYNIDSMIDMMNVDNALLVLKKLKKLPRVVILHRGVDESAFSKEKQIPYYQIKQIKGFYNNILIAVAGGDTITEVQRAIFNDADIVVVWKNFFQADSDTASLADSFLKEI